MRVLAEAGSRDHRAPGMRPSGDKRLGSLLRPLKTLSEWRFRPYYAVAFGADVVLAAWLPTFYVDVNGFELVLRATESQEALLMAGPLLIAPAVTHVDGRRCH